MLRRALFACLALGSLALAACHRGQGANGPSPTAGARLCALGEGTDCRVECEQHNNAGACMELGAMYEAGIGVEIDLKSALALYDRACAMGNGFACSSSGYMYGTGRGTPIDYPKSIGLYSHACDLGVGQGCYNLGVMYESGYGVKPDPRVAVLNFEYACLIGSAAGCSSAGVAYIMGKGVAVANVERGVQYLKQGCAGGNKWGCDRLQELAAAANGGGGGGGAPPPPPTTDGTKGHGSGSSSM
jgi:TPR repeat protein